MWDKASLMRAIVNGGMVAPIAGDKPFNIVIDDIYGFIRKAGEAVVAQVDGYALIGRLTRYGHLCHSIRPIAERLLESLLRAFQSLYIGVWGSLTLR